MKRLILIILKIFGGLVALVLVLLVAAFFYINSSAGQQRLLKFATDLLQEKLETKVQIDSVSVNFGTMDVNLFGLDVEDRQQRPLLQTDCIQVSLDLKDLLAHRVEVKSASIDGLRAKIYQPRDSATNFQFIIDAFKSDKPKPADKPKSKNTLVLDVNRLHLSNIYVEHHHVTKKRGYQMADTYSLKELKLKPKGKKYAVTIDGLRYTTDNHLPRKNAGRPKRGFFDAGHMDVTANMELLVNHYGKDTVNISLISCAARDSVAGFNFSDIHLEAGINKREANLRNVAIKHLNTTISFDSATVQLPSKKEGRKLEYSTSMITGSTILKDISRPFAPVLSRFTIPLSFKVVLSGTDSTMHFRKVHVNTADQKLKIDAKGDITHLQEKEKLFIRFYVNKMNTNAVTAKRIIDQFMVKKFMMRQLNNLGAISFKGSFDVLYKMEKFRGVLNTSHGYMGVNLTLNENTKYLTGHVSTKGFRLGRVIEMKDIDDVGFDANFTFDYSKPRTARVRKLRGGKLPIGQITVSGARTMFKKIKFSDLSATIKSDGVVAQGHIAQTKKYADILCDFTFNNTDSIHKMKIKPGLRLKNMPWQKKMTDEERAQKQEAKQKAKEEKLKAKEEKQKAKEEKQKAKQKAKEEERIVKEAEKEAKKAAKAARKAEKKAAKEQRKAEKEAAKLAKKQLNS